MKLKNDPTIRVDKLSPAILFALMVADGLWKRAGVPHGCTVTSGCEGEPGDGIHSNRSKHYPQNNESGLGEAADLRVWNVDAEKMATDLRGSLGPNYDVVNEGSHIHVEYDVK